MNSATKLWRIFSLRHRVIFLILLVLAGIGAILEVFSIGVLVPVLAFVQQPQKLLDYSVIRKIYDALGYSSPRDFLSLICLSLIALFILKNIYLSIQLWAQHRFIYNRYIQKSNDLFRFYLRSPYTFHLTRNTAQLLRNMQGVFSVMTGVLLPLFYVFTEIFVVSALLIFLLVNDFLTSVLAACWLGAVVGVTYLFIRRRQQSLGEIQKREHGAQIQDVNQALGSVKESKVLCREEFFERSFDSHIRQFASANRLHSLISQTPRFVNEVAVIALVLGLLWFSLRSDRPSEAVFITLGLFAVAAARLMPSMTRISSSLAVVRFYSPNLDEIYEDLLAVVNGPDLPQEIGPQKRLHLEKEIRFDNIRLTYAGAERAAVDGLSLSIRALESVAFVGPSGAGKTTAVDILLGLYDLEGGRITVDGHDIHEDIRAWQRAIGYVPQHIYLSDASIRENVAFGVDAASIDEAAVLRALSMAQLDELVATLPQGLDTFVGERGVRLSGGQRQRIGIARALYHEPEVLVMDEATSALDNETELSLIRALDGLTGKKTIILIAHRLSTVQHCDRIFFLKEGRLAADGTYAELLEKSEEFRKFARHT